MNRICIWPDNDWEYEENMTSMDSINQIKSDDYLLMEVPENMSMEEIDMFVPCINNEDYSSDVCKELLSKFFS